MDAVLQSFLAGFPILLLHFAVTLLLLALGTVIHLLITPYKEIALIRDGNLAAAISLGGIVLGLAIPLAFSMAASVNVYDIVVFGAAAVVLQLLAYYAVDLMLRRLSRRIEDGEVAAAVALVAVKLSVAAINAAAVAG